MGWKYIKKGKNFSDLRIEQDLPPPTFWLGFELFLYRAVTIRYVETSNFMQVSFDTAENTNHVVKDDSPSASFNWIHNGFNSWSNSIQEEKYDIFFINGFACHSENVSNRINLIKIAWNRKFHLFVVWNWCLSCKTWDRDRAFFKRHPHITRRSESRNSRENSQCEVELIYIMKSRSMEFVIFFSALRRNFSRQGFVPSTKPIKSVLLRNGRNCASHRM